LRYHAANRFQTRLVASVNESQIFFFVESANGCPEVPFKLTVGTEIVNVIGVAGEVFRVQRGAEGTTPQSHPQGALVQNRWTAGTYEDLWDGVDNLRDNVEAHKANTTDAHGIDDHITATAADNVHGLAGQVITDFGSNDNGSWVRWSNGLQVCWGLKTFPGEGWAGGGDKYYLLGQSLTFPAPFDRTPIFLGTTRDSAVSVRSAKLASFIVGTSDVTAIAFNGWGTSPDSFVLHWLAIGRWK